MSGVLFSLYYKIFKPIVLLICSINQFLVVMEPCDKFFSRQVIKIFILLALSCTLVINHAWMKLCRLSALLTGERLIVRTFAQSLSRTKNWLRINFCHWVEILISISAFMTGLSLGRMSMKLSLITVFLFYLLFKQKLMLNSYTWTVADLLL